MLCVKLRLRVQAAEIRFLWRVAGLNSMTVWEARKSGFICYVFHVDSYGLVRGLNSTAPTTETIFFHSLRDVSCDLTDYEEPPVEDY